MGLVLSCLDGLCDSECEMDWTRLHTELCSSVFAKSRPSFASSVNVTVGHEKELQ